MTHSTHPARLHGLDTLRAFAIGLVILYHLESFLPNTLTPVADMGWAGVDLFFVLSGYLIGAQLLRPFTRNQPLRIGEFYLRRAYRILPAYLVVLLLYIAVPAWRESPGLDAAWKFLTFTRNLILNFPTMRSHTPGRCAWKSTSTSSCHSCSPCSCASRASPAL